MLPLRRVPLARALPPLVSSSLSSAAPVTACTSNTTSTSTYSMDDDGCTNSPSRGASTDVLSTAPHPNNTPSQPCQHACSSSINTQLHQALRSSSSGLHHCSHRIRPSHFSSAPPARSLASRNSFTSMQAHSAVLSRSFSSSSKGGSGSFNADEELAKVDAAGGFSVPDPKRDEQGGRRIGGHKSPPSGSNPSKIKQPTLAECLEDVDNAALAGAGQLSPGLYVLLAYHLAKRVMGSQHSSLSNKRGDVVKATSVLVGLLLHPGTEAHSVMQLGGKELSQLSWALGVLVGFDARVFSADVQQLCYKIAEHASQPGVMVANMEEACRGWAGVLHGLGKAGVKCQDDSHVQQVFCYALEEQLPGLLVTGQKCVPQDVSNIALACVYVEFKGDMEPFISAVAGRLKEQGISNVMFKAWPQAWSNLIWACGKLFGRAGGQGSVLGEGVAFIMLEGAAAMVHAVGGYKGRQVDAQNLSNTLWGLAHFGWYDVGLISDLASAFVQRISSSKPQEVANVLWALAKLGWYDDDVVSKLAVAAVERVSSSVPQDLANNLWSLSTLGWYDCAVYDKLLWGLVKSIDQLIPQHFSNAMYSSAMASHSGGAVDALACVMSDQDLSGWNGQNVSNALYSWAVLSLLGMASTALHGMACTLFSEANDRDPVAFKEQEITQLHTAQMEAVRVGLQGGGLSAANGLLQAAAEENEQGQAELAEVKRSEASSAEKQAVAALQQAGYEVELGGRVGTDGFAVNLLVQHESCPGGLAIYVVEAGDFFNHPRGQLRGKIAAMHAQIKQKCGGLVVLSEAEATQPAVVVGAVQRELARVAGQGGVVPGISTSSNAGVAPSAPSKREQSRRAAVPPSRKGKP